MPFKSKAQMKKFFSDPRLKKYAAEWMRETGPTKGLPERVGKKKRRSSAPNMPPYHGK